jgi:uncharacterized membrane protein
MPILVRKQLLSYGASAASGRKLAVRKWPLLVPTADLCWSGRMSVVQARIVI